MPCESLISKYEDMFEVETAADCAVEVDRLALRMWLKVQISKYEEQAICYKSKGGGEFSNRLMAKAQALTEVIAHIEAMQK